MTNQENKVGPITTSLAVSAMIGIVLVFIGITMPDGSVLESLLFGAGFTMYFIGLVGGLLSFIIWQGRV